MAADYLYDICDAVLDAALDAISEERTGRPAPDRVFVAHGPSEAQGCPNGQLTVHLDPIVMQYSRQSVSDVMPRSGHAVPLAPIIVRLYRCIDVLMPDGNVPKASDEDDSTRDLMADGWALATGLWAALDGDTFATCRGVHLGRLVPLRSAGKYAGWAMELKVGLSDAVPF